MRVFPLVAPCAILSLVIAPFAQSSPPTKTQTQAGDPQQCRTATNYDTDSNLQNAFAWPLLDFKNRPFVVPIDTCTGTGNKNNSTSRSLTIEKLSSHPPIFRIKNFLTEEECLTLRRLACTTVNEKGQTMGLQDGYVDSDDGLIGGTGQKKKMGLFDANGDGRLSINELIRMVDDFFESHVTSKDIRSMLASINLPLQEPRVSDRENNQGDMADTASVAIQDFVRSDTASMRRFFLRLLEEDPSKRSRHSRMAWLTESSHTGGWRNDMEKENAHLVMDAIQKRVALLTKLPERVVHQAMELQVVHYNYGEKEAPGNGKEEEGSSGSSGNSQGGGHYTTHFDSLSRSSQPCCHITKRTPPCRPCRMATVLYSLSDVENGGHTAFPLAETDPSGGSNNHTAQSVEDWRMSSASRESSYCAASGPGLRIPPDLGQAILWYNHDIGHFSRPTQEASTRAFLGELDRSTLHAGCPSSSTGKHESPKPSVKENLKVLSPWNAPGKWIANHWIEASDVLGEDSEHYASMIRKQEPMKESLYF